jgi:hypothetical protein
MTPNRIVAGATALLGALTVLAGLLASLPAAVAVAAVVAGAVGVLTPVVVWLRGWQAWEARQGEADQPVGWDDVREQLERVVGLLGRQPEPVPLTGVESIQAPQELGYVAATLVEALRDSVPAPVLGEVFAAGGKVRGVVEDPGTEASGYVAPAGMRPMPPAAGYSDPEDAMARGYADPTAPPPYRVGEDDGVADAGLPIVDEAAAAATEAQLAQVSGMLVVDAEVAGVPEVGHDVREDELGAP